MLYEAMNPRAAGPVGIGCDIVPSSRERTETRFDDTMFRAGGRRAAAVTHFAQEESSVRIRVLAVLCFLVASAAHAQTAQPQAAQPAPKQGPAKAGGAAPAPAAAADVNSAKAADIRKLLEVTGTRSMSTQIMTNMATNLKPILANSLPPGEYRAKLIDAFFEKFMARANAEFPKLEDSAVVVYDKYLSDEDIKGLIQFYQTPLGQKTLNTLPKIVSELQGAGEKLGEQMGRETMVQVLAEHPEWKKEMEDARKPPAQ